MNPNLQNAYSRQTSLEVERSLGTGRTVSVGYQYVGGQNLIMSVNQNVATCVAAGTNNGCRPNSTYRNNSQYSSVAESNYHGLHVSFIQRPAAWSSLRVTYTLSKSMNNVGEAFFSSPIDPTDIMRDWARSDDDQRHRLVINGTVNTPMAPATTSWEYLTHGFQLSGLLQSYSALPFNITSGVTEPSGHERATVLGRHDAGRQLRRAHRQSDFAQRGNRKRLLQSRPARQSCLPAERQRATRGSRRSLQSDESREQPDPQHELRTGRLSDKSGAQLQHDHRRRGAKNMAIRTPPDLLIKGRLKAAPTNGARMTASNAISRSALLLVACLAITPADVATGPRSEIAVASRANANASLAAIGQFAAVTWSAATTAGAVDIYASTSRDGGRTFSAPIRVNRTPGDANVGGEQPPRVTLVPNAGRDPSIVVVWTAKDPAGTRLVSARSNDGGQSFLAPARVPGSESPGNRGWESIATTRDGDVVALWLDHRELPARSGRSTQMTSRRAPARRVEGARRERRGTERRCRTRATVEAVLRAAVEPRQRSCAHRRRLLLLQDGDRRGRRWLHSRGVATCLSWKHPRHRVHDVF